MIKSIVAVGKNWEIGKNNGLLFNLKTDMKHFKEITNNSVVVMGYNTFLSLPKAPLKNRINIVLCPDTCTAIDNCIVYHDFNKLMHDLEVMSQLIDCYIIGGGMLYNTSLPYIDEAIITKVDAEDKEATTFFPNLDKNDSFGIIEESEVLQDNNYNIKYVTYRRAM